MNFIVFCWVELSKLENSHYYSYSIQACRNESSSVVIEFLYSQAEPLKVVYYLTFDLITENPLVVYTLITAIFLASGDNVTLSV